MRAAMVTQAGQPPVFGEFRDPEPAPGKSVIRVAASAISHVARARASGAHYSSAGALPFVPGIDGVGRTGDGRRVYFFLPETPFGAMAEAALVDDAHLVALPDALSDDAAAAMAIPAMSSWAALCERAHLKPGETVLVNGATGASGRLAVQIARHLGAGRVITTGRNAAALKDLKALGADQVIELAGDGAALQAALRPVFEGGVDIVLDYLWGPSAEAVMAAAARFGPEGAPIRFIGIGAISGAEITLPSAALRSSSLQLMGSGLGSIPMERLLAAICGVLEAAPKAGFRIALECAPLGDVARLWAKDDARVRTVLVP